MVGLWGVAVPFAWFLGLHEDKGLVGVWWGLCAGYTCMTFGMVAFVTRSDWKAIADLAQKRSEAKRPEEDGEVGVDSITNDKL